MGAVTLLATTGDAAIDRALRGLVAVFEASFPGRVRGYYLMGSYADGGAVAISDIDLLPLFAGVMDTDERERAERLVEGCALLCPTRLDIVVRDEATISREVTLIRFGGLLIYGADTRAKLAQPSLADYTRDTLDAARYFMAHILRGLREGERLAYPLAYPDPTSEFFGYDTVHIPEWYTPGTTHGVKELITTCTRLARAHLALRAGRYTGSKGGSVAEYREAFGADDEWTDLLTQLYVNGKLRWGYAVPAEDAERRLLRDLCQRTLAFENDFLARYRSYLLDLALSGDAEERTQARARLAEVIYPDDAPEGDAAVSAEQGIDESAR